MPKKYRRLIIVIITTLLLMGNVISVMSLRIATREEFINLGQQFTRQTSSMLELWIHDQRRIVQQIAKDQRLIDVCLEPLNKEKRLQATAYLSDLHNSYPYYENLPVGIKTNSPLSILTKGNLITVDHGEFIVDTVNEDTIGKGGISYSYIEEIFNGRSYYISEIYPSIWRKKPIFVVSAPILMEEEILGVAIVSPQMDHFTKLFVDSINLGNTGYMFLIDSSGATIAHNNRDFILNDSPESKHTVTYIVDQIESGNNFFEANLLNVNKYYYGEKITLDSEHIENDMYVVITQNKVEIYSNVHKFALMSLIMVFITALLLYRTFFLINKTHLQEVKEKQLKEMNQALEFKVKERTLQLEDMANRDSLTNLYNHKFINDYLIALINCTGCSRNIVVGIIDIDDFKKVNDVYGHQVGDEVIKGVSEILSAHLRADDLVGRYGGEEFMILLNDIEYAEAIGIAERIRVEILNKNFLDMNLHVSVSIGLTNWQGDEAHTLIKRADHHMYQAKRNGKNQVVTDQL